MPSRPPKHAPGRERQEDEDQRQGQLCVPKAPQNTVTIEAASSQTLLKFLWGLHVLPHVAGVVEWVAVSLRWVYTVSVDLDRGEGFVSTYKKLVLFFPSAHQFSLSPPTPRPATSLQCWTGNISCLPPAVNHHLSNTTTSADSSAWLFREDAVLGDRKFISTWRGAKALLRRWWRSTAQCP